MCSSHFGDCTLLFIISRVVGSFKEVVDGDLKIIGKEDEGFVVGFTLARFVSADGILAHAQFNGKPLLCHMALFA